MTPTIAAITEWVCPQCGKTDQTREAKPHTRMHPCPKLRFLSTPMVRKGTAAKIELIERQDYVGKDRVQLDPEKRRPVMAMVTTRDNGNDVRVFAPTATAATD